MPSHPYDTVAIFTNKSVCVHVSPNEKEAWNRAREWILRGVEEREKGFIIGPSMIQEIQVRPHREAESDMRGAPN